MIEIILITVSCAIVLVALGMEIQKILDLKKRRGKL